jgi:serine/threonine-protein kinase RsbW
MMAGRMGFGMQVDVARPEAPPNGRAMAHHNGALNDRPLQLTFPGHPEQVSQVLQDVFASPPLADLAQDIRGTAEIVLAEVFNNIVEHAYAERGGNITLRLGWQDGALLCQVSDTGAPMPGLCLPAGKFQPLDDLADLPEGGFGWYLIRSLTEELSYRRSNGINRLSFQLCTKQSGA